VNRRRTLPAVAETTGVLAPTVASDGSRGTVEQRFVEGVEEIPGLHADDGNREIRRELRELGGRRPDGVAVVRCRSGDQGVGCQLSGRGWRAYRCRLSGGLRYLDIAGARPHGHGVAVAGGTASTDLDEPGL
jgi:hypothetical protein